MNYQKIIAGVLISFLGVSIASAQVEVQEKIEVEQNTTATSDQMSSETSADAETSASGETRGEDTDDETVAKENDTASPKLLETRAEGDDALDADDDGDGVPTATQNRLREFDKTTPVLFQADGTAASGFEVEIGEESRGNGDVDGDGYLDVALNRVQVNAREVRGWDQEKKDAVRARLEQNSEINSANDFGLQVAQAALDRAEIRNIESTETETSVKYDTEVKLFGFIPMTVQATARAEAESEARVSYPWYAFLAAKGEQGVYLSLAQELRASHDTAMSIVQNMK